MLEKKDPGKFTVRFNIADPQQKTVIEILNKQGRYKAQFLTSAILHYIHCPETPEVRVSSQVGSEEIKRIVRSILAEQQSVLQEAPPKTAEPTDPWAEELPVPSLEAGADIPLGSVDKAAIFKTLDAFQKK